MVEAEPELRVAEVVRVYPGSPFHLFHRPHRIHPVAVEARVVPVVLPEQVEPEELGEQAVIPLRFLWFLLQPEWSLFLIAHIPQRQMQKG